MIDRSRERGAFTVGTVIYFTILAFAVYMGFKFIPVYIAAYDFDNAMKTQAQYSSSFKTDEVLYKELLQKAAELELPITRKQLKIERNQSRLTIYADYVVPVKTAFFTYDWRFQEEESAVLF